MIESLFSPTNYDACKRLLDATTLRHEALAGNLANIETPGYRRVDLAKNFAAEFASRLRCGDQARLPAPTIAEDRDAISHRPDGNTVDRDAELLAMSKNTMEYDVLTEFVSSSLRQLKLAITGRNS